MKDYCAYLCRLVDCTKNLFRRFRIVSSGNLPDHLEDPSGSVFAAYRQAMQKQGWILVSLSKPLQIGRRKPSRDGMEKWCVNQISYPCKSPKSPKT